MVEFNKDYWMNNNNWKLWSIFCGCHPHSLSPATRVPWLIDTPNMCLLCIHCTLGLECSPQIFVGLALPPPKVSTQMLPYQWGLLSFPPHSSVVITSIWYTIYSLVYLFSLFIPPGPRLEHEPTGEAASSCSLLDPQNLKINIDWVNEQIDEHVF